MAKVRVGVIGMGIMGEQYLKVLRQSPLAEPVAIATRSPEKLKRFGDQFKIAIRDVDFRKWLGQVDAVIVATPDFAHRESVVEALKAHKPVLCEKPMATSLEDADAMLQAESASRGWIMVNFNHRWMAAYHNAYVTCKGGGLGEPVGGYARKNDTIFVPTEMISWAGRTTSAHFLSSHDVDLMRWFFGSEGAEACASGVKRVLAGRGIDTYDFIAAQVRFANGAVVTFESGWIYPNTYPTIVDSFVEIIGTQGVLQIDRTKETMAYAEPKKYTYPKVFLNTEIFGRQQGAFPQAVNAFVECVAEGRKPPVTGRDGRQVTAILDAIHRSLASGKPEKVRA